MRFKERKLSDEIAVDLILRIKTNIDSGDSIGVARTKVIGHSFNSRIYKLLIKRQDYIDLVNYYMNKVGNYYGYRKEGLRLKPCSQRPRE